MFLNLYYTVEIKTLHIYMYNTFFKDIYTFLDLTWFYNII